jgi:hypothetical protein
MQNSFIHVKQFFNVSGFIRKQFSNGREFILQVVFQYKQFFNANNLPMKVKFQCKWSSDELLSFWMSGYICVV